MKSIKKILAMLVSCTMILGYLPQGVLSTVALGDNGTCTHSEYQAWNTSNALPTSGKYYLNCDVTPSAIKVLTGDLSLCLNGHTIDLKNKCAAYNTSGYKLTIEDCNAKFDAEGKLSSSGKIVNGKGTNYGAIYINGGSAVLTSIEISSCNSTETAAGGWGGGVFNIRNAGSLTANNCKFANNVSGSEGGVFAFPNNATSGINNKASFSNCIISGNKATAEGGVGYAPNKNSNTVAFDNCNITGNTGKTASVIYKQTEASLTLGIKNCKITGNKTNDSASATNCYVGAVYIMGTGTTIEGATIIKDNTDNNGNSANLLFGNQTAKVDLTQPTASTYLDMGCAIASSQPRKVSGDTLMSLTGDYLGTYKWNDEGLDAYNDNGTIKLKEHVDTPHLHGEQSYTKWTSKTSIPTTSGYYYLSNDIKLASRVSITSSSADIHICLNGHTITGPDDNSHIMMQNGPKLEFCDCTAKFNEDGTLKSAGHISGGHGTYGSAIQLQGSATLKLDSIFVDKNIVNGTSGMGGAILLRSTSSLTAKNVVFAENETQLDGGAICMKDTATASVSSCRFTGNKGKNGSAIRLSSANEFAIEDSVITDNTDLSTDEYCGALYVIGKKVTIIGSTIISDNKNSADTPIAADLMLQNADSSFALKNPTDKTSLSVKTYKNGKGEANKSAGALVATISEGELKGTYTWTSDADLKIAEKSGDLKLVSNHQHGDNDFTKWTSKTSIPTTSGYYYLSEDVKLASRVSITSSSADIHICLNGHTITGPDDNALILMQNGPKLEFCDCTAKFNEDGTLKSAGHISGGHGNYGSAIQTQGTAQLTLNNVIVDNNIGVGTDGRGGAILLRGTSLLTAHNCLFKGNTTQLEGGAILAAETSKAVITDSVFSGNTSVKEGGAIAIKDTADVSLSGCVFTGNNGVNGSAIRIWSSAKAELTDCTFNANTDKAEGIYSGALYITGATKNVTLGGKIVIKDNVNSAASPMAANLMLQDAGTIVVLKDPDIESEVYINSNKGQKTLGSKLAELDGGFYGEYTFTTSELYDVINNNGTLELGYVSEDLVHSHDGVTYTPWESANSLPTESGYYFLYKDIKLEKHGIITGDKEVHICLNGHTIDAGGKDFILNVAAGATVYLEDCKSTVDADNRFRSGGVLRGGKSSEYTGGVMVNGGKLYASGIWFYKNASDCTVTGARAGGAINVRNNETTGDVGFAEIKNCKFSQNTCKCEGGAIAVRGDSKVTIIGSIFEKNSSVKCGGAIYQANSGTKADGTKITLNNCAFKNNTSDAEGGAFAIRYGGKVDTIGGVFEGNVSKLGKAGAIYTEGATVNIKDTEFAKNVAAQGGAIMCYTTNLTIDGKADFHNNEAETAGGAIVAGGSSKLTLISGTLHENSSVNGGAIVVQGKAVLTVNGGKVYANETSQSGAGIYVSTNSKLVINDGQISGNHALNRGGGIYCNGGEVVVAGGNISNNYAKQTGGAIHEMNGKIAISGGKINNNNTDAFGGGIFCNGGELEITGGTISGNRTKTTGGGITIDNKARAVVSGGEISGNKASSAAGIMILNKSVLNMKGGTVSGNNAEKYGGGIYAGSTGTLNMSGGKVSNNSASLGAGGIFVNKSTANLGGGSVSGNKTAQMGGGLCTTGEAIVNFNGTSFLNNHADKNGGGIYLFIGAKPTMNRAKISGNTCNGTGGGVFLQKERLTIGNGVEITKNEAGVCGGGLATGGAGYLVMNGGLISENKAPDGGGLCIQQRTGLLFNAGTISKNVVTSQGGGLYVCPKAEFNMNGGIITENIATFRGAGLFINTDGTMNAGTISKNKILGGEDLNMPSGGGILLCGELPKTFTLNGGEIYENEAANNGGGVRVNFGTTFVMNGGTIRDNNAGICGGGYEVFGTLYTNGGEINNNHAGSNGGAIRVCPQANLYMKDTVMNGNSCDKTGGAVHLKSGTGGTFEGCTITNNKSTGAGGAIWAGDELSIKDTVITGNTSKEGGAVWIEPGEDDGRSYVHSVLKLSGDVIVKDNGGKDPYYCLTEGNCVAIAGELGDKAYIETKLSDGEIGSKVIGVYGYEASDDIYILKKGDASLSIFDGNATSPEGGSNSSVSPWIFAGGGIGLIVIAGLVVLLLMKKKKKA